MTRITIKLLEAHIATLEERIVVLENEMANTLTTPVDPPWTPDEEVQDEHIVVDTAGYIAGTHRCGRCAGTGRFITRVENGKPVGPAGRSCFRCNGKGKHTQVDRKRNYGHDMNYVPPLNA